MAKTVNLPKSITIQGVKCNLRWNVLDSMDGWYAEISKRALAKMFEANPDLSWNTIEQEAAQADGVDYSRMGVSGPWTSRNQWVCVYVRA